jgi:hypothetical protein
MLELAGYYDGTRVQLLEGARIKKNQILKIIVTNDFVDEQKMESEPLPTAVRDEAQRAYARLLSLAKPGIGSGDYKKDLMEMLERKYADAD